MIRVPGPGRNILGCDVSHWQGAPDFTAVRASGREFVVLKATEGASGVDPECAASRSRAHAAGLVVGLYHYARAGDPAAEADRFCRTVGEPAGDEFPCLDWEVPGDPVGWCRAWLATVRGRLGRAPLLYLNQSLRDGHDWTAVVAGGSPLWLARYDGSPEPVPAGRWPRLAMKQYSRTGSVPGIAGHVDLDVFYGDVGELRMLGLPAAPGS
jgi:GH25 family lysozyme M1 (1,4-beta-N-acetylmuramidase)